MEEESSCSSSLSSLWEVIVKCDDICFTHVLPRLNVTDLKFLYGVNPETRALIKRSTRADDVKKWFRVNEMSSISTLKVAWEHFPWGRYIDVGEEEEEEVEIELDEPYFCERVAETNKLELLKWAREKKKCEWDVWTIYTAAEQGNWEMVKYCVANKCPIHIHACAYAAKSGNLEMLKYLRKKKAPWDSDTASWAAAKGHLHIFEYLVERKYNKYDEWACANAAEFGHLDCLKYLHETAKAPWDFWTAAWAARNGHLHILEYLVERKYDKYNKWACAWAARDGHLDCLEYLHETAKWPWDYEAVQRAHENKQTECLQYLLDNNCPLPLCWSYEGGKLYTFADR